jgi:hypothetical protein
LHTTGPLEGVGGQALEADGLRHGDELEGRDVAAEAMAVALLLGSLHDAGRVALSV